MSAGATTGALAVGEHAAGGGTPTTASHRIAWGNVVLAALLMLATLPGRTQGLGLITEPMLADLRIDRLVYADINFWATLFGALLCLPVGRLLDRFGVRWITCLIVLLLGGVVWRMGVMAGGAMMLFVWVLLTRALGQSALSVVSIATVGKSTRGRSEWAMGIYSVLLSVFFMAAFVYIGHIVSTRGWREAWSQVSIALVLGVAPICLLFLREPTRASTAVNSEPLSGVTLSRAMRSSAFWIFAGATALFGLVSSGLGLFNEAVLAEFGFDQKSFHTFLAVMTMFALAGQMLCGWLALRRPLSRLLAVAMFLYAIALGILPVLRTHVQLWLLAAIMGVAAGFITVIFFAVWGQAYGRAHLGRIQGAAQTLTVLASALGPRVFEQCHVATGSYAPLLYSMAPIVLLTGFLAWRAKLPSPHTPLVP